MSIDWNSLGGHILTVVMIFKTVTDIAINVRDIFNQKSNPIPDQG